MKRKYSVLCATFASLPLICSVSCSILNQGWNKLSSGNHFYNLAIDKQNDILYFATTFGNTITYLSDTQNKNLKSIQLPDDEVIKDICIGQRIFVILPTEENNVIEIIKGTNELNITSQYLPKEKVNYCYQKGGNVFFVGENKIIENTNDDSWNYFENINLGKITRIYQNEKGELFILINNESIYRYNNDYWEKIITFSGLVKKSSNFLFEDKTIIISRGDEIEKIYEKKDNLQENVIKTLSRDEMTIEIINISSNTILIATTQAIYSFQGKRMIEHNLPFGVTHINTITYEKDSNRLYVATNNGVYYMIISE
jgi:ligand-binding sensor domain-containing protein